MEAQIQMGTVSEPYRPTTATLLAFMAGICVGLGVWSGARWFLGITEAWDAFGYYFACLLISGTLGGIIFPVNYPYLFAGVLLSQLAYLFYLGLSENHSAPSFLWPLGVLSVIIFSSLTLLLGRAGSYLVRLCIRERRRSQNER